MKYLPKRTLLDDVLQVYYSIECTVEINDWNYSCSGCRNEIICKKIENFLNSLKKFYYEVID